LLPDLHEGLHSLSELIGYRSASHTQHEKDRSEGRRQSMLLHERDVGGQEVDDVVGDPTRNENYCISRGKLSTLSTLVDAAVGPYKQASKQAPPFGRRKQPLEHALKVSAYNSEPDPKVSAHDRLLVSVLQQSERASCEKNYPSSPKREVGLHT
jgi:hypothetical protein